MAPLAPWLLLALYSVLGLANVTRGGLALQVGPWVGSTSVGVWRCWVSA